MKKLELSEMEQLQGGGTFECLNAVMASAAAWSAMCKNPGSPVAAVTWFMSGYAMAEACI